MTTITEARPRPVVVAYQRTLFVSLVLSFAINLILLYASRGMGFLPETLDRGEGPEALSATLIFFLPLVPTIMGLVVYSLIRLVTRHAFLVFSIPAALMMILVAALGPTLYHDITLGAHLTLSVMYAVMGGSFLWAIRRFLR